MARRPKFIPTASRLSKVLEELRRAPRPYLNNVTSLKLTMAFRNDHFGARHFVKEELPRIQYTNPAMQIDVVKKPKAKNELWKPEMVLQLRDGTTQTLDLEGKWSSAILEELMDIGGGSAWARWKRERLAAGLPVVEVPQAKKVEPKAAKWSGEQKKGKNAEPELVLDPTKTGAAAVLP
ncbi:hypothetical protein NM688_g4874 [Phlebia brevispora]|uniref:Uncharacterized protein n=1 Tax=Phlebia brevispora TaxID=194682 RepID=A0ACC1T1R6_9APHY|nr:hypothetical protein NM688_g4874 [Phlebia brevispora]